MTVNGDTILVATGVSGVAGGLYLRASDTDPFVSLAPSGNLPAAFGPVFELIADSTDATSYYAVLASNGAGNNGGL